MGKHIIAFGLGGIGSRVAEKFSHKIKEKEGSITSVAVDTDRISLGEIESIPNISLSFVDSFGTLYEKFEGFKGALSSTYSNSDGFIKALSMTGSANGWRLKGLYAFNNYLSIDKNREYVKSFIDEITIDNFDQTEIYIISSLCGGTGSSLILPFSLYIRKLIKEKFGTSIKMKALLALPDAFENNFQDDLKMIAYSNTYATLKEINAVDLITKKYSSDEEREKGCFGIHFRIGDESTSGMGLLFDADIKEYQSTEYMPFDKIYLFDKVPGVSLISEHETIMSNLLYGVHAGLYNSNSESLYEGISLTQITHPVDDIISYISKRSLLKDVEEEILPLYTKAENGLNKKIETYSSYGMRLQNLDEEYCEIIRDLVDKNVDKYTSLSKFILNREALTEKGVTDGGINTFLDNVTNAFEKIINPTGDKEFNEEIKEIQKKTDRKYGIFANKEKCIEEIQENVDEYMSLIKRYYLSQAKAFEANRQKMIDMLLTKDGGENPISIVSNFLMSEDKFLHPTIAFANLAKLLGRVNKVLGYVNEDEILIETDIVPKEFLKRDYTSLFSDEGGRVRYKLSTFNLTLFELVNHEGFKLKPAFIDSIITHMQQIIRVIRENFNRAIGKVILDVVTSLFNTYKNLYRVMRNGSRMIGPDVAELYYKDTISNSSVYYINSSTKDKELIFEDYNKELYEDGIKLDSKDQLFGEVIFTEARNLVKEGKENEVFIETAYSIFNKIEAKELEIAKESSYYKEFKAKSVLEVMLVPPYFKTVTDQIIKRDLRVALSVTALPLKYKVLDVQKQVVSDKILNISENVAKFILTNQEKFGIKSDSKEDVVDKLLFSMGILDLDVNISKELNDNDIFVSWRISNIELYDLIKVNEELGSLYYQKYLKSLEFIDLQMTEMRNPHIFNVKYAFTDIPYISPSMKREYYLSTAKALLYSLYSGTVMLQKGKDKDFLVYGGREITPIEMEGTYIEPDDICGLLKWIQAHNGMRIHWSSKYDEIVELQKNQLPVYSFGATANLQRNITVAPIINSFIYNIYKLGDNVGKWMNLVELAYSIKKNEGENNMSGFSSYILEVGDRTLRDFCNFRCFGVNENVAKFLYDRESKYIKTNKMLKLSSDDFDYEDEDLDRDVNKQVDLKKNKDLIDFCNSIEFFKEYYMY